MRLETGQKVEKCAVPNGKRFHTRLEQIDDDIMAGFFGLFFFLTLEKLLKTKTKDQLIKFLQQESNKCELSMNALLFGS